MSKNPIPWSVIVRPNSIEEATLFSSPYPRNDKKIAELYSRGPNPARLKGTAAERKIIGTIMRHWETETFTLVALRQRKKDTAKNTCDKMEAKIVIFFLLLISKRLTAARPVIDFEKKILILEFKKGANTTTNKSKKYNKTSVLCSRYSSLAKNIFLSKIIE